MALHSFERAAIVASGIVPGLLKLSISIQKKEKDG